MMGYAFHRHWLTGKFEEIRRRVLGALDKLDDEQVKWRPGLGDRYKSTSI